MKITKTTVIIVIAIAILSAASMIGYYGYGVGLEDLFPTWLNDSITGVFVIITLAIVLLLTFWGIKSWIQRRKQ